VMSFLFHFCTLSIQSTNGLIRRAAGCITLAKSGLILKDVFCAGGVVRRSHSKLGSSGSDAEYRRANDQSGQFGYAYFVGLQCRLVTSGFGNGRRRFWRSR
jgi:hypothetical protein